MFLFGCCCFFFAVNPLTYGPNNICYEVFMVPFEIMPLILSHKFFVLCIVWGCLVSNIEYMQESNWTQDEILWLCMKNDALFIRRHVIRLLFDFYLTLHYYFFSSSPTICHSGSFFVLFFFSLALYVCSDKLHLLQWNFHQKYCLVHVLTKKKTARQKCHIFWYIIRI